MSDDVPVTEFIATQLAKFVASKQIDDIPPAVVDDIGKHILDSLGSMRAGARQSWNETIIRYAEEQSRTGACTVISSSLKLSSEWAAFANATCAHGIELDDYHVPAAVHAGAVVVPAALAVAEEVDSSLEDLIVAVAVGYEAIIRFGLAMSPEMTQDRGFHVTSAFGPFGAAAASASLRKLPVAEIEHALGIAASQAGGLTEYSRSGGEVKRVHAGFAAMAGIRAATLASMGLTAPISAIEGPRGFIAAFGGRRADQRALTEGLGTQWHINGVGIKAWATCTGNHPAIAALDEVMKNGVTVAEIEKFTLYVDQTSAGHCGHIGPIVKDMTEAQFSMHATIGMRLALGGNDIGHYDDFRRANFNIPAVTAIAERVDVTIGAKQDRSFSTDPFATIEVHLTDGTVLRADGRAPGSPANPFSWTQVIGKVVASNPHPEIEGFANALAASLKSPGHRSVRRWTEVQNFMTGHTPTRRAQPAGQRSAAADTLA